MRDRDECYAASARPRDRGRTAVGEVWAGWFASFVFSGA